MPGCATTAPATCRLWKADKLIRRLVGPNPFRAHDAIGAAGANFLTWSCLHHLAKHYGPLFEPTPELEEHKETGAGWYPPNHFRPLVNWRLDGPDEDEFESWILGPVFQMTSLLLQEKRAHLSHINAIGELCAQFRIGALALARRHGPESVVRRVEAYQRLHPAAAESPWHPEVFEAMEGPDWQQLYVNAEHDGTVGVISINRERYNADVDRELIRAVDWLLAAGIRRVILSGDFHLSTQMVGADTDEFFPALSNTEAGYAISHGWSRTARRFEEEFETSVGFVHGKRCLGGYLELLTHCHYVVAVEDAELGLPEVTLPVVPGMEGCHWPLRKCPVPDRPRVLQLLLSGRPVVARDAVGWLIDAAGPMESALGTVWGLAMGTSASVSRRRLETAPLDPIPGPPPGLPDAASPDNEAARKAILDCALAASAVPVSEALELQAKHSAAFMVSDPCRRGRVGAEAAKTMNV